MNNNIIKYPLKLKTEQPKFNYLIRSNDNMNYYLFNRFNDALDRLKLMSIEERGHIACLYEPYFNNKTREWFGQNTFTAYDGEIEYDKYGKSDLHLEFYVNAGLWLNPEIEL